MSLRLRVSVAICDALWNPATAAAQIAECQYREGETPIVSAITVSDVDGGDAELSALRVEAHSGDFLYVYYDPPSETIARAYASCLGTQITLLKDQLGDERQGAEWDSVVFSSDPAYASPRGEGIRTRWVINSNASQTVGLDPESPTIIIDRERMILRTLPHEQVHDFQQRANATLPRWFAEGHATWVGWRVASILSPKAGEIERAERLAELDDATEALDLANWGSIRPRREAIMRQLSPADRARMEADPSYFPAGGSFTFTADDLETDISNEGPRYAGAFLIFEGLAERHGAEKVRIWAREVTASADLADQASLAASIERHFGEDLEVLLAD